MQNYIIKPSKGKLAANLAMKCQPGKSGAFLIESGLNQENFNFFLAKLAEINFVKMGKDAQVLAQAFKMVSASNASAARQALGGCEIEFLGEDGKRDGKFHATLDVKSREDQPMSIEAYWLANGGAAPIGDTSALEE